MEGDATKLPFEDESFDITISNTVQEHIEPSAFWGEQKRVLKSGGKCICLSARKGIRCLAECLEKTEVENSFWEAQPGFEEELERFQVCQYPMTEADRQCALEAVITTHSDGYFGISGQRIRRELMVFI